VLRLVIVGFSIFFLSFWFSVEVCDPTPLVLVEVELFSIQESFSPPSFFFFLRDIICGLVLPPPCRSSNPALPLHLPPLLPTPDSAPHPTVLLLFPHNQQSPLLSLKALLSDNLLVLALPSPGVQIFFIFMSSLSRNSPPPHNAAFLQFPFM